MYHPCFQISVLQWPEPWSYIDFLPKKTNEHQRLFGHFSFIKIRHVLFPISWWKKYIPSKHVLKRWSSSKSLIRGKGKLLWGPPTYKETRDMGSPDHWAIAIAAHEAPCGKWGPLESRMVFWECCIFHCNSLHFLLQGPFCWAIWTVQWFWRHADEPTNGSLKDIHFSCPLADQRGTVTIG